MLLAFLRSISWLEPIFVVSFHFCELLLCALLYLFHSSSIKALLFIKKKKKSLVIDGYILLTWEKKRLYLLPLSYFDEWLALYLFLSILIFKLLIQVGSFAAFVVRHRKLVGRGNEDLQHIAHIIILNMVCFPIFFSFVRLLLLIFLWFSNYHVIVRIVKINYHMVVQNTDQCTC